MLILPFTHMNNLEKVTIIVNLLNTQGLLLHSITKSHEHFQKIFSQDFSRQFFVAPVEEKKLD